MLRRLVVSLVVLPMLWIATSTAPASASAIPTLEGRGCCSHHHGQCGCQGNRIVCCDNTLSPTCTC